MQELSLDALSNISGGDNVVLGTMLVLGGATILLMISGIGRHNTPYNQPRCRMVETPFTEVVPVYDRYGVYLGDQVNTYVETKEVCY